MQLTHQHVTEGTSGYVWKAGVLDASDPNKPDAIRLTLTSVGEVGGHSVTISLSGEEGIDFLKGLLADVVQSNPKGTAEILLENR